MAQKNLELDHMEEHLGKWGAQIDEWGTLAAHARRGDFQRERRYIAELQGKRDVLLVRMAELKATSPDKWHAVKAIAEAAYADLEAAFAKVVVSDDVER